MIYLPEILLPKQKYFGLSIERTSLRATEVDSSGNPVRISEIKLPSGMFNNGLIVRPDVFSSSLQSLIKSAKISTPYVVVCFPEVFAYTRGHELPKMPISELDEAVKWQAKDLFPFPSEDLYFDWKIINTDEKNIQVVVVAVQKSVLDQFVSGLQSVGLKPLRFEPDATALARLLLLKTDENALLVEILPNGAYITLVEGEKSLFTTVVQFAQGDSSEQFLKSIDQTLLEIDNFYRDKHILNKNTTHIVVTGDLASENWVGHLQQLLGYKAQILKTKMQQQGFNKSYAAAISGIAPPLDENSINLMPTTLQEQYDLQRSIQFMNALLTRVVIILVILCLLSGAFLGFARYNNNLIDKKVKLAEAQIKSQPVKVENVLQLNSLAQYINSIGKLKLSPKDKILTIFGLIPQSVQVTQLDYEDRRLTYRITGIANTRDDLIAFKNSLENSKQFTNIDLPLVSLESPIQVPFIITFVSK